MMRSWKLALTLAPFAVASAAIVVLVGFTSWTLALEAMGYAGVTFVAAGKFIVLAPVLREDVFFTPFFFAGMVAFMDVCTALLVALHLDVLYRLPWLGRRLRWMERNGRETLERRRFYRRSAFFGVILFVMFPLTGTGAIGGTIFGRLIGLTSARILTAIAIGAVAGSFGLALGAEGLARLLEPVRHTAWFRAIGYGAAAALLAILVWRGIRASPREAPAAPLDGASVPDKETSPTPPLPPEVHDP
ncbi:MAG: small multi-drug export protein [Planctomycetes bacterium]|nr:small multi-drug export protein [Planctomycetota bacterium]